MSTFSADVVAMRHGPASPLTEQGYFLDPRNNHLIHIPILRLSQRYQIISLTTMEEESIVRQKSLEPQRVTIGPTFSHRDVCRRISNWPRVEGLDRQRQTIRSLKGIKSLNGVKVESWEGERRLWRVQCQWKIPLDYGSPNHRSRINKAQLKMALQLSETIDV